MGVKRKNVGFLYIADVIIILMKDKTGRLRITSEIYPMVAQMRHTTKGSVERGVRTSIESLFTSAKSYEIQQYYPFPYDEERGRPTCTEFLRNMAKRLKL